MISCRHGYLNHACLTATFSIPIPSPEVLTYKTQRYLQEKLHVWCKWWTGANTFLWDSALCQHLPHAQLGWWITLHLSVTKKNFARNAGWIQRATSVHLMPANKHQHWKIQKGNFVPQMGDFVPVAASARGMHRKLSWNPDYGGEKWDQHLLPGRSWQGRGREAQKCGEKKVEKTLIMSSRVSVVQLSALIPTGCSFPWQLCNI